MAYSTLLIILIITLDTIVLINCGSEEITAKDLEKIQGKPLGFGLPQIKVDEVDGFPRVRDFFGKYVLLQKPLVIRGGAKTSPAFTKWTDAYLLSLDVPRDEKIIVEYGKKEDRDGDADEIHFHQFLLTYNTSDTYMVNPVPPYLRDDVVLPCILKCPGMRLTETLTWFSSGGTKSVLHNDDVDNLNCLYRGRKQLIMIDYMYRDSYSLDRKSNSFSSLDVDAVDYTKYPSLASVEYYNVSMEAGDCLYIPYKVAHQVRSFGNNLAVNVWWDHFANEDVDVDNCPDDCPTTTLAQATFGGDEPTEESEIFSFAKEMFLALFPVDGVSMKLEEVAEALLGMPHLESLAPMMPSDIKSIITQAVRALDIDGNSRLNRGEIESSPVRYWYNVLRLVKEILVPNGGDEKENTRTRRDEL